MRVPDVIRKCVVFVGSTNKDGRQLLRGTAFLIAREVEGLPNRWFNYFVTARHVIDGIRRKGEEPWLRVNMVDGSVDQICMKVDDWIVHDSDATVDAAILWTAPGALRPFDHRGFSWRNILTPEAIAHEGVGVGQDTFVVGLFVNHYGKNRNLPIIRVGNIAAMPEEKVHTAWGDIDAYLIEARSIGGLSGSPVFAFLGPHKLKETEQTVEYVLDARVQGIFYLMGLIHGHFDAITPAEFDLVVAEDGSQQFQERLNVGIGIVVPMTKVMEIFDQNRVKAFEARIRDEIVRAENVNHDEGGPQKPSGETDCSTSGEEMK